MVESSGYSDHGMTDDYSEEMNWDEIGKAVPVGTYDLEVVKAEYKPTKEGKHAVSTQFKIVAAHEPDNTESVGKMLFENFAFTSAAGFRVKNFALAAGLDLPTTISKDIVREWGDAIVGVQVAGKVKHRVWNEQTMANIGQFIPVGGPAAAPAEAPPPPPAASAKTNGANGSHKPTAAPSKTPAKPAAPAAKGKTSSTPRR